MRGGLRCPLRPTFFAPTALSLLLVVGDPAHAQQRDGLVVMPLKSGSVEGEALTVMGEHLAVTLTKLSPLRIVTFQDIEVQLDREQMKDLLACDQIACAAEIGGALGTRYLLAGSLRKFAGKLIVTLSLIDTKAQSTSRAQAKVDSEVQYETAITMAVTDVLKAAGKLQAPSGSTQKDRAARETSGHVAQAAPPDVAAPPPGAKRTASGLASRLLKPGTGDRKPTPTSRVTMHYTGWTTDGRSFDSSVIRGQPATVPLSGVIAGLAEGLQLMRLGEKRRFWIPEALAYEARAGRPAGMLVFDVELLEIAGE